MRDAILDAWPLLVMFAALVGAARPVFWVIGRLMGWC